MKPLVLLISVFIIGYLIRNLLNRNQPELKLLARIAMSSMLLFTGVAHFIFVNGMMNMLPAELPFRIELIYASGVFEILGAIGLLSRMSAKLTGWCLIVFLILVLPANIYAAINHLNPLTGSQDGPGINYLFFRIPLQLFFIGWIYLSAIKSKSNCKP